MKKGIVTILGAMGSGYYDEMSANMMLADIRKSLTALVGDYKVAVVLVDRGDCGFELCELEVPAGTEPGTIRPTLTELYYRSGEWGSESILLAMRWVDEESGVLELPFASDGTPAPQAVPIIPTAVPVGTMILGVADAYDRLGHMRRRRAMCS